MISIIKDNLPVFVVILPLFVAFILPTIRKMEIVENLAIFVSVLGLIGAAYLSFLILTRENTSILYYMGGWSPPWGIELEVGNLGVFFLLVISLVSLPVSLYAKNNLTKEIGDKGKIIRFHVLYLLLIGALAGMAITKDLFNVFVLVEVATLSCCALVSAREHPQAAKAAFTYLILATLGSTFVLAGIGFIYIITGHLNMEFASLELSRIWQESPRVVWLAFSFMLVGFGVKSALFPLHIWLPDAHSTAPTPASALLSGLAVKGYVICLFKILCKVFGHTLMGRFTVYGILSVAGITAIIVGSISALAQDELKRRLAFSTVAQMGYIFLGLGLMNTKGLSGGLFYLASHAISKSILFLAAGAILTVTGKEKISEMAGIGRKMPITMGAFTVGSLSLIGIPLFSGFVGKWHLIMGGLEGGNIFAVISMIVGSILCAAYLLPVIRIAYFEPSPESNWKDPGLPQKVSLIFLALSIVILGILPGSFIELAKNAAGELLTLP